MWAPEAGSWQAQSCSASSTTLRLAFPGMGQAPIYSARIRLGWKCVCDSSTLVFWCSGTSGLQSRLLKGRVEAWGFRGPGAEPTHSSRKCDTFRYHLVFTKPGYLGGGWSRAALASSFAPFLFVHHRREWKDERCLSQAYLLLPPEVRASRWKDSIL